ncbi:Ppx/GppA phosphatase family protein [Bacillus alkalicellulosilyticus]|uniref:Ppx/GppA phosphatase family protein n=1 Tax=Alkalihalobacterium alkalicellulosilyticum TaxID=1912214 RepID=UPI000997F734|nr:Ppx/GppA phosphatase family protein [Bacillus alkalicellulosilyticus]
MEEKKVAIIDMGSNSIRLVINKLYKNGYYKQLYNFKVVARLSSHFTPDGKISKQGIQVILTTLKQFKEIIDFHKVEKITGVATAAVRKAINQNEIITAIQEQTGLSFRVLSGYEEAHYGYLAVVNSTNLQEGITIDIGGGSTEVTLFKDREMVHFESFPFGAITLQQLLDSGDPSDDQIEKLTSYLISQFESLPWLKNCGLPVIGIGGSARNLSLIHQRMVGYPLAGLHQYQLSKEGIISVQDKLRSFSIDERHNIDGLSKDRTDIIIPAVQAILTLVNFTNAPSFTMSNKGLRDGIFYEEVLSQLGLEHFPNVAEESFYQLTHAFEMNIEHVKQVGTLAKKIYKQLTPYLTEMRNAEEDIKLLKYSSRVLYIGEFITSEASSEHTFYVLTNLSIDGLTHRERLALALIASFKSRSSLYRHAESFSQLLTKEDVKQFELLGAILKLSFALNRTRRNVVHKVKVKNGKETDILLHVTCLQDSVFEEQLANKYKKHIEKAIQAKISLEFQQTSSTSY